jgi:hypothetical protein
MENGEKTEKPVTPEGNGSKPHGAGLIAFSAASCEAVRQKFFSSGAGAEEPSFLNEFLLVCSRLGIHPIATGGIFPAFVAEDKGRPAMRIITAVATMAAVAQRDGGYAGTVASLWAGEDGVWKDFWPTPATPPVAAKVLVRSSVSPEPIVGIAMYAEYAGGGRDWKQMPAQKLANCAQAIALRNGFPAVLGGVFCAEECENEILQSQPGPSSTPGGPAFSKTRGPADGLASIPGMSCLCSSDRLVIPDADGLASATVPPPPVGSVAPSVARDIAPAEDDDYEEEPQGALTLEEAFATSASFQNYAGTVADMPNSRLFWAISTPHLPPRNKSPELARYALALATIKEAMASEGVADPCVFREMFFANKSANFVEDDLPDLDEEPKKLGR